MDQDINLSVVCDDTVDLRPFKGERKLILLSLSPLGLDPIASKMIFVLFLIVSGFNAMFALLFRRTHWQMERRRLRLQQQQKPTDLSSA